MYVSTIEILSTPEIPVCACLCVCVHACVCACMLCTCLYNWNKCQKLCPKYIVQNGCKQYVNSRLESSEMQLLTEAVVVGKKCKNMDGEAIINHTLVPILRHMYCGFKLIIS